MSHLTTRAWIACAALAPLALLAAGRAAGAEAGARPAEPRLERIRSGPGAGLHLAIDGRPLLLVGDSVTQGWVESGEDFDQDAYVRALSARGIRALHLWSFIAPQTSDEERIGYDAPEILPWTRTREGGWDLGRFDDRYFRRLRALCASARDHGVFVIVQVFDGWTKTRFDTHPFRRANGGPLADRAAFVELADHDRELPEAPRPGWGWRHRNQHHQERFAARLIEATSDLGNVLYELFNEGEWYDRTARRRHEVHFLAFFRARCRSLLVTNDDHIAGASFRREANCDVISHHLPRWTHETSARTAYDAYRRETSATPAKPILFSEPVPEFVGKDERELEAMTRLMWGTTLAGAGFLVQNDLSFGFNPKAAIAARSKMRDRMLDREGVCSRFFNELGVGWASMVPDPTVTSTRVALAAPGREYVVWSERGDAFTVDLSRAPGVELEGRFYDPRTGGLGRPRRLQGGDASVRVAKPDARDWVFWIRGGDRAPALLRSASSEEPDADR